MPWPELVEMAVCTCRKANGEASEAGGPRGPGCDGGRGGEGAKGFNIMAVVVEQVSFFKKLGQ